MQKDSASRTIIVASILCIVCSVIVSTAAVKLRPSQELNKKLDIKKNLLLASGLLESKAASKNEILEKFKMVETKLVDLETGEEVTDINPDNYNPRKAAKTKDQGYTIPGDQDVAKIKYRSKLAKVYFIKEGGNTTKLVLPVNGKGLWSTMYGFLVLTPDTTTVKGIGFYEHGETPGLGGEIDNPSWQAIWTGKKPFNTSFEPVLKVVKGQVDASTPGAETKVDGLAGATMTSNGVTGMIQYWLGQNGYGPYLNKLRTSMGQ